MSKLYVLKQQWLDITPGAILEKHPDNFYYEVSGQFKKNAFPCSFVETNTEYFRLKEDIKIQVPFFDEYADNRYWFDTTKPIPPEKYEQVKKAIEDCLSEKYEPIPIHQPISEANPRGNVVGYDKIYTETDLIRAKIEAFNAAKEVYQNNPTGRIEYYDGDWSDYYPYRYKTWDDYINSKK
jgi:hypothetical protein